MKRTWYEIMLGLIKKIFIGLLTGLVNGSNYTKFLNMYFLREQPLENLIKNNFFFNTCFFNKSLLFVIPTLKKENSKIRKVNNKTSNFT